jgi:hypothetical protein
VTQKILDEKQSDCVNTGKPKKPEFLGNVGLAKWLALRKYVCEVCDV